MDEYCPDTVRYPVLKETSRQGRVDLGLHLLSRTQVRDVRGMGQFTSARENENSRRGSRETSTTIQINHMIFFPILCVDIMKEILWFPF